MHLDVKQKGCIFNCLSFYLYTIVAEPSTSINQMLLSIEFSLVCFLNFYDVINQEERNNRHYQS